MLTNILAFCPWPRSSKNREDGKNGEKSKNWTKDELLKSLIDGESEFKFR